MRWSAYRYIGRGPFTWLAKDDPFEAIWDVVVESGLDDVAPDAPPPPPGDPRITRRRVPPVADIPPGGVGDDPPPVDEYVICVGAFIACLDDNLDLPIGDYVAENVGLAIPVGSSEVLFKEPDQTAPSFIFVSGLQALLDASGDLPVSSSVVSQVNGGIPVGASEVEVQEG